MTGSQIVWLELGLVGGCGLILFLTGVIIKVAAKMRNTRCTEKAIGTVVKHKFYGKGNMCPVIEYSVNGKEYRARKKFKGIKTVKISGLLPIKSDAYEDEKGWLNVKTGSAANYRVLAEKLWPCGSEMTVYYNPEKPKECYVERPVYGGIVPVIFVATGIGTMVISVLIFFLMGM